MGGDICCSDGNKNNQSITVHIFFLSIITNYFIVKL